MALSQPRATSLTSTGGFGVLASDKTDNHGLCERAHPGVKGAWGRSLMLLAGQGMKAVCGVRVQDTGGQGTAHSMSTQWKGF